MSPYTNQACVGVLRQTEKDLEVKEISRVTIPKSWLIQHSHEPCITPNYFISKLDHFGTRGGGDAPSSGMLRMLHQIEDSLWLVMDRRTNSSRLLSSELKFVSNHFTNCVEIDDQIVFDSVAVTSDYLDAFFEDELEQTPRWDALFLPPQRCSIPIDTSDDHIICERSFDETETVIYDYPTFNPEWKMNPLSQYYYGIAPASRSSQWFDSVVKFNSKTRRVDATWAEEGVYVSEADYIAYPGADAEDDGALITLTYNMTSGKSGVVILDAARLTLLDQYDLAYVLPFNAHGTVCNAQKRCFSNP